jgi:hypothetical protein
LLKLPPFSPHHSWQTTQICSVDREVNSRASAIFAPAILVHYFDISVSSSEPAPL